MNKLTIKTSPTSAQKRNVEVEKPPQFIGPQLPISWPKTEVKRELSLNLNEEKIRSDNNNKPQRLVNLQPHHTITMQIRQNTRFIVYFLKHYKIDKKSVRRNPNRSHSQQTYTIIRACIFFLLLKCKRIKRTLEIILEKNFKRDIIFNSVLQIYPFTFPFRFTFYPFNPLHLFPFFRTNK